MSMLRVAATQMACSWDLPANLDRAENLIREAAAGGAQVILIQELFETPYFCIEQDTKHFDLATTLEQNQSLKRFQALAKELDVVLPFSWFERANRAFYNSLAMVDAGGEILGIYRKSHIPNGPGYQEKNYFNPGDTGFKVWDTRYGKIGTGVCWDQWFPEAARSMALMGAELLLYPTAIGWAPEDDDTEKHRQQESWFTIQRAHAIANGLPIMVCNRVGPEPDPSDRTAGIRFWGNSFVAGPQGEVLASASADSAELLIASVNMRRSEQVRRGWPYLRDRRVDAYDDLSLRFRDPA